MNESVINIVAGPDFVIHSGGSIPLTKPGIGSAIERASIFQRRTVLWIHESAAVAWNLPETEDALEHSITIPDDAKSGPGWYRMTPKLHIAFPAFSGDFADLETPEDLIAALDLFRSIMGTDFLYSAPSTVLHVIESRFRGRRPEKPSSVPFAQSYFAVPAHVWRSGTDDEWSAEAIGPGPGARFAQLYDRRGSYLAAWRSCELPDGEWADLGGGPVGALAPGYYLTALRELRAYVAAQGLYDPFQRQRPEDPRKAPDADHAWLTAPLVSLAKELAAEMGDELRIDRAVVAPRSVRPLDLIAGRISDGRAHLDQQGGPTSAAVLDVLKDGYTRGTAHFEFGRRPPHPLHRPEWRHTIVDRHVANTFRSIRRASRRPLVFGAVDSAIFETSGTNDDPSGLRMGPELGSWRRRGTPLALDEAARLSKAGGGRGLLAAMMRRASEAS